MSTKCKYKLERDLLHRKRKVLAFIFQTNISPATGRNLACNFTPVPFNLHFATWNYPQLYCRLGNYGGFHSFCFCNTEKPVLTKIQRVFRKIRIKMSEKQ